MPCMRCALIIKPPPTTGPAPPPGRSAVVASRSLALATTRPSRGAGERIAGGRRAPVCFKWPGEGVVLIESVDPTVRRLFCPRLRVWCTRVRTVPRTCVNGTNDEY
jgi:hypothetical protein